MSGVDAAAGILAFIELGFSFAKAVNEFCTAYKEAPTEIKALPDRIVETLGLLDEVANLLKRNDKTHVWSDLGVTRAKQNAEDCKVIVISLKDLLQRVGIKTDDLPAAAQDLDLSFFNQSAWALRYKSKFKKTTGQLHELTSKITLTVLTFQSRTSNSNVQKAATDKKLARLLAKEMASSNDPQKSSKGKGRGSSSNESIRHAVRRYRKSKKQKSNDLYEVDVSSADSESDEETNLDNIVSMLKNRARMEIEQEQLDAEAKQRDLQKLRDAAVQKWKADTHDQLQALETRRSQLRKELSGRLEASAIESILANMFPVITDASLTHKLAGTGNSGGQNASNVVQNSNADPSHVSKTLNARGGRFGLFRKGKRRSPELDAELREMLSPAGRSSLRGIVVSYDQGKQIHSAPMGAPQQALQEKLSANLSKSGQSSRHESKPWEEFAQLPTNLRKKIEKERKMLGEDWSLVHIERMIQRNRRLFRRQVEQLQGVLVIFYRPHDVGTSNRPAPPGDGEITHESRSRSSSWGAASRIFRGPRVDRHASFKHEVDEVLDPSKKEYKSHSHPGKEKKAPSRYGIPEASTKPWIRITKRRSRSRSRGLDRTRDEDHRGRRGSYYPMGYPAHEVADTYERSHVVPPPKDYFYKTYGHPQRFYPQSPIESYPVPADVPSYRERRKYSSHGRRRSPALYGPDDRILRSPSPMIESAAQRPEVTTYTETVPQIQSRVHTAAAEEEAKKEAKRLRTEEKKEEERYKKRLWRIQMEDERILDREIEEEQKARLRKSKIRSRGRRLSISRSPPPSDDGTSRSRSRTGEQENQVATDEQVAQFLAQLTTAPHDGAGAPAPTTEGAQEENTDNQDSDAAARLDDACQQLDTDPGQEVERDIEGHALYRQPRVDPEDPSTR